MRTPDMVYEDVIKKFESFGLPNKMNLLINSLVDISFTDTDHGMSERYCIRTTVQSIRVSDLKNNDGRQVLVICFPPLPFHGLKIDGVRLYIINEPRINLVYAEGGPKLMNPDYTFSGITICPAPSHLDVVPQG